MHNIMIPTTPFPLIIIGIFVSGDVKGESYHDDIFRMQEMDGFGGGDLDSGLYGYQF